jgi:hypothetical protein
VKADWFRGCAIKRAYATEAEAQEPGSRVYMCLWCGKWHRTGLGKPKNEHGRQARVDAIWERHLKRCGRAKG